MNMDAKNALITAAELFVQPAFRERFVHEGVKKPAKLMRRIAHDIESVFENQFVGVNIAFHEADFCWIYSLTGRLKATTWGEARTLVDIGGGGVLIIDVSGRKFFAQSEGFPPPKQCAGDLLQR